MKNIPLSTNLLKPLLLSASLLLVLSSCKTTQASEKGNWSRADLQRARNEMESERQQMDELIGKKKTDAFIDCALQKVEMRYRNYEEANSDILGIENLAEQCMREIM